MTGTDNRSLRTVIVAGFFSCLVPLVFAAAMFVSTTGASAQDRPGRNFLEPPEGFIPAQDYSGQTRAIVQESVQLMSDIYAVQCPTPAEYRRLAGLVDKEVGKIDRQIAKLNTPFGVMRFADDINSLRANDKALVEALIRLKRRCAEPDKPVTPSSAPTPSPTPKPVPPVTDAEPKPLATCPACQWIVDQIEGNSDKIAALERSQKSLRKAPLTAGIQLALNEDDARIAFLKGQNEMLQARLEFCRVQQCRASGKPPVQGQRPVGGGYYERPNGNSGVRFLISVEGGFDGARAFYDDLRVDPRSFIAGASVGVRAYQPYDMFFGAQVSVLGTDLTREAVPGFSVGLRWAVPVDFQVGRTFQTGSTPVSIYGFAGPMWGETRVASFGAADYFILFGVTAGFGVDVQLNQNWSVGAKARAFTLGPGDRMSEGQHVDGGSLTVNVTYQF